MRKKGVVITVLVLAVGAAGAAVAFFGLGHFDISATQSMSALEERLAIRVRDASIRRRAPIGFQPPAATPELLSRGMNRYRQSCLICHGAPGLSDPHIGSALNPPAPNLTLDTQTRPHGELFWITKHGIRMTGMPGFASSYTDPEIGEIVTFLRHLPTLSEAERRAMKAPILVKRAQDISD
jgi:mono/diheme cytochrome c family protein